MFQYKVLIAKLFGASVYCCQLCWDSNINLDDGVYFVNQYVQQFNNYDCKYFTHKAFLFLVFNWNENSKTFFKTFASFGLDISDYEHENFLFVISPGAENVSKYLGKISCY